MSNVLAVDDHAVGVAHLALEYDDLVRESWAARCPQEKVARRVLRAELMANHWALIRDLPVGTDRARSMALVDARRWLTDHDAEYQDWKERQP